MNLPILVTSQEYFAAAFVFFQLGMFCTAKVLFQFPDEIYK